jgi:soluble lytic murein transglycosylase-like protein
MIISNDSAGFMQLADLRNVKTRHSTLPPDQSESNFHNILSGLLSNGENSVLPSSGMSALNKEQLMFLCRALQIQMNSRLYNTVFNNALESNYLAAMIIQDFGKMNPVASNNSQAMTKRGFSAGGTDFEQIINQAAQKYDVDANLIRSVIKAESNFNPSATSPVGAMGLMQLMPGTARELGVKNAYDPEENIMAGAKYLKMLLNRYEGQVDLALAAYNWGMGNLEKNPGRLPAETLNYVEEVTAYYKNLKA